MIPLLLLALLSSSAAAQKCLSDTAFSNNRLYATCSSLPHLGAALHWTYYPSNGTVDIAYRAPQTSSGWIAWALNPTSNMMSGSQALIAFPNPSTTSMSVYAVPIGAGYNPTVKDANLSFRVYSKSAVYANNAITIYATIALPGNKTTVNQVWQAGTQFDSNGVPSGHAQSGDNIQSFGSVDFQTGLATAGGGGGSRLHRKNTHGVINAVSWGILMPLGAIIARYMRVFKSADPAWFYLHIACQCSAYIIGVAGWGTGLKLGSESVGITYHAHRAIGIALFCLATLQVFALLLRPNKDHKYRIYWNVYHHLIGYTVIILSVVNIFKGFDVLKPDNKWKHVYIAIIGTLAGIAVILEVATWAIVLKRKSRGSDKSHHGTNGVNGYNGGRV